MQLLGFGMCGQNQWGPKRGENFSKHLKSKFPKYPKLRLDYVFVYGFLWVVYGGFTGCLRLRVSITGFLRVKTWFLDPLTITTPNLCKPNSELSVIAAKLSCIAVHIASTNNPTPHEIHFSIPMGYQGVCCKSNILTHRAFPHQSNHHPHPDPQMTGMG